jgi:hypothetical protein
VAQVTGSHLGKRVSDRLRWGNEHDVAADECHTPGLNVTALDEDVVRLDDGLEHAVPGCRHERGLIIRESRLAQGAAWWR